MARLTGADPETFEPEPSPFEPAPDEFYREPEGYADAVDQDPREIGVNRDYSDEPRFWAEQDDVDRALRDGQGVEYRDGAVRVAGEHQDAEASTEAGAEAGQ